MKDLLPKESLLYISVALTGYGINALGTEFWQGLLALVLGAGCLVGRAYLKKQGFDLAGKK